VASCAHSGLKGTGRNFLPHKGLIGEMAEHLRQFDAPGESFKPWRMEKCFNCVVASAFLFILNGTLHWSLWRWIGEKLFGPMQETLPTVLGALLLEWGVISRMGLCSGMRWAETSEFHGAREQILWSRALRHRMAGYLLYNKSGGERVKGHQESLKCSLHGGVTFHERTVRQWTWGSVWQKKE
jgi:hypothetical protein